jgi:hypothetical protein
MNKLESTRLFVAMLVAQVLATVTQANPLHFAQFTPIVSGLASNGKEVAEEDYIEQAANANEAKAIFEKSLDDEGTLFGFAPEDQTVVGVTNLDTGEVTRFDEPPQEQ